VCDMLSDPAATEQGARVTDSTHRRTIDPEGVARPEAIDPVAGRRFDPTGAPGAKR
jgi:hypothetical protein